MNNIFLLRHRNLDKSKNTKILLLKQSYGLENVTTVL